MSEQDMEGLATGYEEARIQTSEHLAFRIRACLSGVADPRRVNAFCALDALWSRASDTLTAENTALRMEVARLRDAFGRTHVAGQDGNMDCCHECRLDIRNLIHRALARKSTTERESDWRLIETAPKDGTEVVLFGGGVLSYSAVGYWVGDYWGGWSHDHIEPTHWILPPDSLTPNQGRER